VKIVIDTHLIQTIEQGSRVKIQVYEVETGSALAPVFQQEKDLCEGLELFDLICPIKSGVETRERSVALPDAIPDGAKYFVVAEAWTANGDLLVCLQGSLEF
jgi:ML domain